MTESKARQLEAARAVKEEKRKAKLALKEKEELEAAVRETEEYKQHRRKRAPATRRPQSAPVDIPPRNAEPEPEDDGIMWV
jgi:sRNA-binding protein